MQGQRQFWVTGGDTGASRSAERWQTLGFLCPSWVQPFINSVLQNDLFS